MSAIRHRIKRLSCFNIVGINEIPISMIHGVNMTKSNSKRHSYNTFPIYFTFYLSNTFSLQGFAHRLSILPQIEISEIFRGYNLRNISDSILLFKYCRDFSSPYTPGKCNDHMSVSFLLCL